MMNDWMSEGPPMTILVVDDEEPVRTFVSTVFRRDGYQVLSADSALRALELWRENRETVDLVVTDFHLGRPTAGALIDAIRAESGICPFLVLTGAMSEEERAAVGPKVVGILHKPVRHAELLAAARRVLFGVVSRE
ncbi:MAG: response regulator [Parcubacteria group bacterium]|nr:response regulator [Parcubacteria group bacterium]